MKNLLCILFLALSMSIHAQVAINTDGSLPDNSAMLDVKSTEKGLLFPRMTLAQRNAIVSPAAGLMIYQTDNTPGYYYNSGSIENPTWAMVGSGSGWSLTGNGGTNPATNFLGTTDGQPLKFKVNNQKAGCVDYAFPTNTGFGYQALNSGSGHNNTAYGYQALYSNTTAYMITAIGEQALYSNTTGTFNVACGFRALYLNSGGNDNIAVGSETLLENTSASQNTAIGNFALASQSYNPGHSWASNNVAVGYKALVFNQPTSTSNGINNTALGTYSLLGNTTGSFNTASGCYSLSSNSDGNNNTANGYYSLLSNTNGYQNTACGARALQLNDLGDNNCAFGYTALSANLGGSNNTATGTQALYSNNSGFQNTAIGSDALYGNTNGYNNTASGMSALYSNTTGIMNTAVGCNSQSAEVSGWQNTALGASSMEINVTGPYNTAIGFNTGPNDPGFYNTTCLGIDATATGSNMVRIGNGFVGSIGGQVGWTTLSDGRFKENVKADVPGLSFINQLRPVTYQLNREKISEYNGVAERRNQIRKKFPTVQFQEDEKYTLSTTGFIAQEVEAAAKKTGFDFSGVDAPKNDKDMYGLRYAEFVVPLVKAVQELNQKNELLEKMNKELLARIEKLETK